MATTSIHVANLFSVDGLVAVITGGGSGIGRMMARALALNGAHKVYILGRRKEVLDATAASVSTSNIVPMICDVTSKESLENVVAAIKADTGYINVLVANAGILGHRPESVLTAESSVLEIQKTLQQTRPDQFAEILNVNTIAPYYTILAFLALLDEGNKAGNVQQKSQVIATSSIAGFMQTAQGVSCYGQSKAALTFMMKQFSTLLTPKGIRSNILCPGIYPSEMTDSVFQTHLVTESAKNIPLERWGSEEDIAGYILFLTSRAGGYLSGDVTVSDGGLLDSLP